MKMYVTLERLAVNLVTVEVDAETGDDAEKIALEALSGPNGFDDPRILRTIEDNLFPDNGSPWEGVDVSMPDGSAPPERD
jgi:hypothetical protein